MYVWNDPWHKICFGDKFVLVFFECEQKIVFLQSHIHKCIATKNIKTSISVFQRETSFQIECCTVLLTVRRSQTKHPFIHFLFVFRAALLANGMKVKNWRWQKIIPPIILLLLYKQKENVTIHNFIIIIKLVIKWRIKVCCWVEIVCCDMMVCYVTYNGDEFIWDLDCIWNIHCSAMMIYACLRSPLDTHCRYLYFVFACKMSCDFYRCFLKGVYF